MTFTNLPNDFGTDSMLTRDLLIADDAWDFCGWAVVDNMFGLGEGSKVLPGAFDDNDRKIVPIVWAHNHCDSWAVLGRAILVVKPGGIYCYGKFFENSEIAKGVWSAILDGNVRTLSIYANNLKLDDNRNVVKGDIHEVSLAYLKDQPEEYRDTIIEKWKEPTRQEVDK